MNSIYPVGYRVLIKPDPLEEKSEGGIIIQYENKEAVEAATTTGEVVALGKEAFGMHKGDEPWVEKGDKVYYAKYAGKHLLDPTTKEALIILNDEDIIGVIRNV